MILTSLLVTHFLKVHSKKLLISARFCFDITEIVLSLIQAAREGNWSLHFGALCVPLASTEWAIMLLRSSTVHVMQQQKRMEKAHLTVLGNSLKCNYSMLLAIMQHYGWRLQWQYHKCLRNWEQWWLWPICLTCWKCWCLMMSVIYLIIFYESVTATFPWFLHHGICFKYVYKS